MFRKLLAGIAVAAGLFSIAIGVQRWIDAHAAENVVRSLMNAVVDGDRATALSLLSADRRDLLDSRLASQSPASDWSRQTGVSYEILAVQVQGDAAQASVRMEKDGFTLEPTIYLRRNATSRWKVDLVEGMQVDPRYLQRRRAHEREQGKQLANRLQKALEGRPGVTVDRVKISELPRDASQ